MENYREKIKHQCALIAVCSFTIAAVCFLAAAAEFWDFPFPVPSGDSHWQAMWRGFICGAALSVLFIMIFYLVRNIIALQNDAALKKLYVKEHDERTAQVWQTARAEAYRTCLIVGIVAAIVSGFFSMTVSITIIACIAVLSYTGLAYKFYYDRKF